MKNQFENQITDEVPKNMIAETSFDLNDYKILNKNNNLKFLSVSNSVPNFNSKKGLANNMTNPK